jgi:hypothetical protein
MAYAVYPTTLPVPEIPLNGEIYLPLAVSNLGEIGAFESRREKTRANLDGSSVIFLDSASQFGTIFIPFYKVTLNDGLRYFTAPWLTLFGYKGYVARILSFKQNLKGVKPNINLNFEFIPDVQYSISAPTIPSPFPAKANA